ncbi:unnamed protein product [Rhodiola kirilowii]
MDGQDAIWRNPYLSYVFELLGFIKSAEQKSVTFDPKS